MSPEYIARAYVDEGLITPPGDITKQASVQSILNLIINTDHFQEILKREAALCCADVKHVMKRLRNLYHEFCETAHSFHRVMDIYEDNYNQNDYVALRAIFEEQKRLKNPLSCSIVYRKKIKEENKEDKGPK
jgi:hypothetical protein